MHFMSFLHIDMTQVVETLSQVKQELNYSIQSIPHAGSPPRKKTKSNRGDPALHLHQARGHLNWQMGLPALLGGNLGRWII